MKFYAHSTDNPDKSDWQELFPHLAGVSDFSGSFAKPFHAQDWGRANGLLHDTGKATIDFVHRLEGASIRVNHSIFGARIAKDQGGPFGLLLSYMIAGHHGGLPDGGFQEGQLHYRLKHEKLPSDVTLIQEVFCPPNLVLPFKPQRETAGFSVSFFVRMLFSCLTDADFLDTEKFCDPDKSRIRYQLPGKTNFKALQHVLTDHLHEKQKNAPKSTVNRVRNEVLVQCREKAKKRKGFFSLTVPTGGGKTLSSLSFALDHLVEHTMQRIIYAIPFTSIIEQNARVFSNILGKENVLEHHCNYKEKDTPEEAGYDKWRGLAAENWDAPVVVTTNVQFFESLFSNKPSRCRKLHNIANSVIILDEVQAIPSDYLEPCLAALKELVSHYECSIVLCTATQPALDDESTLQMALQEKDIEKIIEEPAEHFEILKRTKVSFLGKLSDDELALQLQDHEQVLCIVSTKKQAHAVFTKLKTDKNQKNIFHLSTYMYPEHRRTVLAEIREVLEAGLPCKVISTNLIEAGVDLDFPVVYRAMAGLDAMAQAAGRCNREGKLEVLGQVFIFEPEIPSSMAWLKRCASRASEVLRTLPNEDPIGLTAIRRYFELLYDIQELDKKGIVKALNVPLSKDLIFPFRTVAEQFRMIEDEGIGVIIPKMPECKKGVEELRHTLYPHSTVRKLQQYSVSVRSRELAKLITAGAVEMIHDKYPVLQNLASYNEYLGLCSDEGDIWDTAALNL